MGASKFKKFVYGFFFFGLLGIPIAQSATLSSSVLMFHLGDVHRMKAQIDKAVALGNKSLNFVLTLHHISDVKTHQLEKLCYMEGEGTSGCKPITADFLKMFSELLVENFSYAASLGLNISVVPHLDDGSQRGFWRNNLIFDPLVKVGEYSYAEAMIWPIANALKSAAKKIAPSELPVELVLQGESGATIFHSANSYLKLLQDLKIFFHDPKVKIGISLNFNLIGGSEFSYSDAQIQDVQALVNEVDFIGLSAYAAVNVPPQARDFDKSLQTLLAEFAEFGVSVPLQTPFRYSEVGIGGGTLLNDGTSPARTASQAAEAPYAGIYGEFNEAKNPWSSESMMEFRYAFHAALLEYLQRPDLQSRPILSAYLWNANSWDPQGLYESTKGYADPRIIELLKRGLRAQ